MPNTNSTDLERDTPDYWSITDASQTGLDITGNLTIEMWVKVESAPAASAIYIMVSKIEGLDTDRQYQLQYSADAVGVKRLQFQNSADGQTVTTGTINYDLGTATWVHVAVVYTASAGQMELFINGASQGTATGLDTSIANTAAPFRIGAGLHSGTTPPFRPFDGIIDDVRMWASARTASQISANYQCELNASQIADTNLKGYWKFNGDALDETTNNNDLTSNGSPTSSTDVPFSGGDCSAKLLNNLLTLKVG